tara:strand:+ start:259 stop:618 length:360 start_codon:yes stop_codon:yes gene_type:complete
MEDMDQIIDTELEILKEEKYKIRLFQIEMILGIDAEYGVEDVSQHLRAIPGITVVTVLGSNYNKNNRTYRSHVRFKFHPKKEAASPASYVKKVLLPAIRGSSIPGTKILRIVNKPERIS